MAFLRGIVSELLCRSVFLLVSVAIISIVYAVNANKVLLLMLDKLKTTNIDWYDDVIYEVLWYSFDTFDTYIRHSDIDLHTCVNVTNNIPSFEIAIDTNGNNILFTIMLQLSLIIIYYTLTYHAYLINIRSMYAHEIYSYRYIITGYVVLVPLAIMCANNCWAFIYLQLYFHNYAEYSYFEFDTYIDMNTYVYRYVMALNYHIALIAISNSMCKNVLLTYIFVFADVAVLEAVYYSILSEIILFFRYTKHCIMQRLLS